MNYSRTTMISCQPSRALARRGQWIRGWKRMKKHVGNITGGLLFVRGTWYAKGKEDADKFRCLCGVAFPPSFRAFSGRFKMLLLLRYKSNSRLEIQATKIRVRDLIKMNMGFFSVQGSSLDLPLEILRWLPMAPERKKRQLVKVSHLGEKTRFWAQGNAKPSLQLFMGWFGQVWACSCCAMPSARAASRVQES